MLLRSAGTGLRLTCRPGLIRSNPELPGWPGVYYESKRSVFFQAVGGVLTGNL